MKNLLATLVLGVATVSATAIPDDAQTIQHVLNRIALRPRPGDVERVRRWGCSATSTSSCTPSGFPDPAMAARLAGLDDGR